MSALECPAACPSLPSEPSHRPANHRFIAVGGVRFHTVQLGDGPLVLLLHGFPEFWYSWRRQLPALAERFHVVAPDLRGYNLTTRPPRGYELPRLVNDVAGLIAALGAERAHVVGHDWGGVIAWALAMWAPARVAKLAVLNAPHPAAYLRELRRNPRQLARSWYVLFFQLPWLPERLLGWNQAWPIAALLRRTAVEPSAFSGADLAAYRRVFAQPGALQAALFYYRALGRVGLRRLAGSLRPIQAPTLLLWGEQDVALLPELTAGLERWVPRLRVVRLPEAGHWLHLERPERVNAELLHFLA